MYGTVIAADVVTDLMGTSSPSAKIRTYKANGNPCCPLHPRETPLLIDSPYRCGKAGCIHGVPAAFKFCSVACALPEKKTQKTVEVVSKPHRFVLKVKKFKRVQCRKTPCPRRAAFD